MLAFNHFLSNISLLLDTTQQEMCDLILKYQHKHLKLINLSLEAKCTGLNRTKMLAMNANFS